jgi:anaerobic selenocysteine-containing dehydrogenase
VFFDTEKTPRLDIHPDDASARGIVDGDKVRAFNDRGALVLTARVTTKARPGVVVALSIWWRKLSPDGTNANMVTGQALTDMGRAATFYDALVEVQKI